jgi:hypothetical protein
MRLPLLALVLATLWANVATAADDGLTQPKVSYAYNNSSVTATDLIATTNGGGNVKGVLCQLHRDVADNLPNAVVKFYVNGGSAQSVTLRYDYVPQSGDAGFVAAHTGWVPFNVRFTTSIRITIQKEDTSSSGAIKCAASWALD